MPEIDLRAGGDRQRDRIVAAALRCIARWGLAKTNVEDVAREAGCSRATLYRAFPGGKDAVFDAVAGAELRRLETAVATAVAATDDGDVEGALVAAITAIGRHLDGHDVFRFLLLHEPELVLPHLAFHRLDALLARVRAFGGPLLERAGHLPPDVAARTAEWVARIVISYTCSPSAGVQLTDDPSVRRLVRAFVLPGLLVPSPR
jgi:AcrR family transcriptional regulator